MKNVLSTILALSLLIPTLLLVCESNDSTNPLLPQIIGALYCFALYLFVTLTKFGGYLWRCFNAFVDYLNKLDKPFKN